MGFLSWFHDSTAGLLTLAALGIALLLVLIIRVKLEPFIALIVVGFAVALLGGVSIEDLVGSATKANESVLESGFAGTLGHVTAIIGLGTVLGAILERSGAAEVLLDRLVRVFGEKGTPYAMGLAGFILGIPVFFDIGIFVLAPLVYVGARRGGGSLAKYAFPLLAGLSVTHCLLPPHPGPVAAAGMFGVDLGWVILFGLICGIPAFVLAGWYGMWIGEKINNAVPEDMVMEKSEADLSRTPPPLALVLLAIGLPMVLILGGTFGNIFLPASGFRSFLLLVGTPTVALTLAVLISGWLLCLRRGMTLAEVNEMISKSLHPVGMLLLVIGAGAFFGKVLSATGVGDAVADSLAGAGMPLIVAAFVISSGLRIAQGSATVAIVTTGGILTNSVAAGGFSQPQLALILIGVACGSVIAGHVNDGGFWIISRYFNISVKDMLKSWTVLETIISFVGFGIAITLWQFV
ncbi:GntP family permease [Micrococcales bacterium 31B]|nr:GntP family permease [Micrococcales bacterium 31B]